MERWLGLFHEGCYLFYIYSIYIYLHIYTFFNIYIFTYWIPRLPNTKGEEV